MLFCRKSIKVSGQKQVGWRLSHECSSGGTKGHTVCDLYWSALRPLLVGVPISSGRSPELRCGVLKKVDSGTGKLGCGLTVLCANRSER